MYFSKFMKLVRLTKTANITTKMSFPSLKLRKWELKLTHFGFPGKSITHMRQNPTFLLKIMHHDGETTRGESEPQSHRLKNGEVHNKNRWVQLRARALLIFSFKAMSFEFKIINFLSENNIKYPQRSSRWKKPRYMSPSRKIFSPQPSAKLSAQPPS